MPSARRWTLRALLAVVTVLLVETTAFAGIIADGAPADAAATNVVGMAPTPSGAGFWLAGSDGSITTVGDAVLFGSMAGRALNLPIVGIAATPTGKGYWIVATDGGIFSYGDAAFFGSTGAMRLNQPIVGMAGTTTGKGYWLVASDGGIFSFGDARFFGSTGNLKLVQPITAMTPTSSGKGYWLTADDGGIFSFGDAQFYGSGGGRTRSDTIVGMATSSTGGGYWLVSEGGTVLAYGDAPNLGSVTASAPVVGIMRQPASAGYVVAAADGSAATFGSAPIVNQAPTSIEGRIAQDIVARINDERAARGLAAVTWDPALAGLAADWSRTMATTGNFAHRDLSAAMGLPGISGSFQGLGENIAWASGGVLSSGRVHAMLMNSNGHRVNILQPAFDSVGVAVTCVAGKIYATENFGRHVTTAAPGYAAGTPALQPVMHNDTGGPAC